MIAVVPKPQVLPKLTLIYAKMQALAEPARMLMCYGGVEYEDVYPWDHYGKPWREGGKEATPFGQVPVLLVDNCVSIDQSSSIQRYLATLTETCPVEPVLAAIADALCENASELFRISNPIANFFKGKAFPQKVAAFEKQFEPRLSDFAKALTAFDSGPFFLGERPMYCDFTIFHHFQIAQLLSPLVFDNYPAVRDFMSAMAELPGVVDYLQNRARLIDVGTAPILIQNGVRIQPGFE